MNHKILDLEKKIYKEKIILVCGKSEDKKTQKQRNRGSDPTKIWAEWGSLVAIAESQAGREKEKDYVLYISFKM